MYCMFCNVCVIAGGPLAQTQTHRSRKHPESLYLQEDQPISHSHSQATQEGREEDEDGSGRNPHQEPDRVGGEPNRNESGSFLSSSLQSSPSGLRNLGRPPCVFFNNTERHRLFLFHQQAVELTQLWLTLELVGSGQQFSSCWWVGGLDQTLQESFHLKQTHFNFLLESVTWSNCMFLVW